MSSLPVNDVAEVKLEREKGEDVVSLPLVLCKGTEKHSFGVLRRGGTDRVITLAAFWENKTMGWMLAGYAEKATPSL